MIIYKTGDIFKEDVQVLVNAVNTKGVMGAGLARQFKLKFPEYFSSYKNMCNNGLLFIGNIHIHKNKEAAGPDFIVSLPTKKEWKFKSNIEYIESGLKVLKAWIEMTNIKSIAIPALGCGLGGLSWEDVKPVIETELSGLESVKIVVMEPLK